MQVIDNNLLFVAKKWGNFKQFNKNEHCTVKLLEIKKGESISYQYHNYRSEQWYVVSGRVIVTKGNEISTLIPNMVTTIDVGEKHKMEGLEDSIVLEISRGHFDEQDIVRLDLIASK